MLVFGHTGITLGAAVLLAGALAGSRSSKATENEAMESSSLSSQVAPTFSGSPSHKASWLSSLGSYIDIRLLLIGSLLPDIIDKPVGQFFFRDTFSNGRIFSHSILFLLLITLAGLYLYRSHGKTWLFVFSFGTFTHLICDQMWLNLPTLLWPLYGWTFAKHDLTHWMGNMFYALLTNPTVYIPEIVGIAILIWFAWTLVRRKKVYAFIRNGQA